MVWIAAAVMVVAGVVALIVMMLTRRAVRLDELGPVSDRWIANHRVDSL